MNNRSFFRILVGVVALVSSAKAVTVATPPAGCVRLEASGGRDTWLSLPLVRRSEFVGRISSVGAATITVNASPFGVNAYAPSSTGSYQVQFVTGNLAGLCYKIVSNTASSLTIATLGDDLTAHSLGAVDTGANSDMVRIRPSWTIGDLFGPANGGLLLNPVTDASAAIYTAGDAVLLPDHQSFGTEKSYAATIVFAGETWRQLGQPNSDYRAAELFAGAPFVLRRQEGEAFSTFLVGYVAQEPGVIRFPALPAGGEIDVPAALFRPVNTRVADAGLALAFEGSPNAATARDLLLMPSDIRDGFSIPPGRRLHLQGTAWFEGESPADDQTLRFGSGFIIRLKGERPVRYWRQSDSN
jgi:uncharacterized protein (TIGR02597 family)